MWQMLKSMFTGSSASNIEKLEARAEAKATAFVEGIEQALDESLAKFRQRVGLDADEPEPKALAEKKRKPERLTA